MFVMFVYDVEQTRTEKYRKLLAQYLDHEQKSVFMGSLTAAQLKVLQTRVKRLLRPGDAVTQVCVQNRHNAEVTRFSKGDGPGPAAEAIDSGHRLDHRLI